MLCVFETVPVAKVLKLVASHLEPTGSDKAAEERGMYFGKLFALLALIRSEKLKEEVCSSFFLILKMVSECTLIVCFFMICLQEDIINVAQQLHTCSQRKNYLREFGYVSLGQLVDLCHSQGSDDVIRDHVMSLALDTGWEGCTAEQMFLYLHLDSIYGKVCQTSLIKAFSVVFYCKYAKLIYVTL